MNSRHISRRCFLAATGTICAFPTIIPASALGREGRPAPSGRVNLGLIGCGVEGITDNLRNFLNNDNTQVISVCDPVSEAPLYGYRAKLQGGREPARRRINEFYAKKTEKAKYNGCKVFADFREMLEDKDLDAVCVATPDHWHVLIGVMAARKGKHIYGQKPLSNCVADGRALCNAVKENNVVFQTGSQGRSSDPYRRIGAELIRNKRLGKLHRIQLGLPGGLAVWGKTEKQLSEQPTQPPSYVDFDMWLGPAPQRQYIPKLHLPMQWRFNFDYGGGMVTDHGAHFIDVLQWSLGTDETGPVAIEDIWGEMDKPDSLYNVAANYSCELVYADGTRVHVSTDFGETPGRFLRYFGENDRELYMCSGKLETKPFDLIREKPRDGEIKLPVSSNHEHNFIEGIMTGNPVISPCETGHRTITIAHLINIGLRLGKRNLKWNPDTEKFVNDPAADKLLSVAYRKPWTLEG